MDQACGILPVYNIKQRSDCDQQFRRRSLQEFIKYTIIPTGIIILSFLMHFKTSSAEISFSKSTTEGYQYNRDKKQTKKTNQLPTTDSHHRPVRLYAQRPGTGLQAKYFHSKVCAPNTRPYKSRIKTEMTCLTVYTITPMHWATFSYYNEHSTTYQVSICKVSAIVYHRFHVGKKIGRKTNKLCRAEICTATQGGTILCIGKVSLRLNIQQWQHNILTTYRLTRISCIHVGNTGHLVA